MVVINLVAASKSNERPVDKMNFLTLKCAWKMNISDRKSRKRDERFLIERFPHIVSSTYTHTPTQHDVYIVDINAMSQRPDTEIQAKESFENFLFALQIHFIHSSFALYSMKNCIISQYGARTIPLSVINNFSLATAPFYVSLSACHRQYFDWMVTVTHRSNNIINLFYVRLAVLLAGNRFMLYHLRFMIWPTCLYSTRVLKTYFSL